MAELRPALSVLRENPYRWLLTLDIAGRIVRLSTDGPVTVTGTDGTDYPYTGGLAPAAFERLLELFNDSPSSRSASFEVLLDFDLAQLVARGLPLFAATGELAQWYEDQPFERRRVVLRGDLDEPAYGALGESVSFTVTEDPGLDRAVLPLSTWIVDEETTFPESGNLGPDPGIVGAVYPLIIGGPGQALSTGTTSSILSEEVPGSPALLVRRDSAAGVTLTDYRILVAGGRVESSDVKIVNLTTTSKTFSTSTLATATDGLGQRYTYVNPIGTSSIPAEGDELYAIWDPADGGGLRSPFDTVGLRGAGDVIRWALQSSTLRIDHSRLAELSVLNAFKLDSFINTPISPWEWLSSNVLPLLPVTVATGPDGLYVVPWSAEALQDSQALEVLEDGRNCTRIGDVIYTSSTGVANEITLRFAPDAATGTLAQRRTLSGATYDSTDPNTLPNFWCRRSRGVYRGQPRKLEISSSVLFDVATVEALLASLARRYTFPRREILYRCPRDLDWLRPGDAVRLTDADLHLTEAIVTIGPIGYQDDALVVQLIVFEPLRFEK